MKTKTGKPGEFLPHTQHFKKTKKGKILICKNCRVISLNKRWLRDEKIYQKTIQDKTGSFALVLCPGCLKIKEKKIDGYVELKGSFLTSHQKEILNLVKNVAQKADEDNPVNKILTIEEKKDSLSIATTSWWLAERIGKEVKKAFKGELLIQPAPRSSFVRVFWERNL